MSIKSGTVSVEDGHKNGGPNDYVPTRKVRVDLSFLVEDGQDFQTIFDYTTLVADQKVNQLLGRSNQPTEVREREKALDQKLAKINKEAEKVVEPIVQPIVNKANELTKAVDVLAMEEPANPTGSVGAIFVKTAEAISAPAASSTSVELTAADVYKQVTKTQEQIKSAPKIVALIRKHTADLPVEKQIVSGIPADRRQAFLDDLELLRTSAASVS